MSYDIRFKVKVENVDYYVPVGNCNANITWNVTDIIKKSTGLPWENCANNGLCKDVIPKIEKGYIELFRYGYKYEKYEPSNGWGSVKSTLEFFHEILEAWEDLLKWHGELCDVVTFWIE